MKKIGYLLLITAVASMLLATLIGLTVGLLEIPFGGDFFFKTLMTVFLCTTICVNSR